MKPRIIILDGPDAVGKTTAALRIASSLPNCQYFHSTWTHKLGDAIEDYMWNVLNNAITNLQHNRPVVLDRHWPSEVCYGRVMRPLRRFEHEKFRERLSAVGVIYLFCYHSRLVYQHRRNVDRDHPYSDDQILAVDNYYQDLYLCMMADRRDNEDIFRFSPIEDGLGCVWPRLFDV